MEHHGQGGWFGTATLTLGGYCAPCEITAIIHGNEHYVGR